MATAIGSERMSFLLLKTQACSCTTESRLTVFLDDPALKEQPLGDLATLTATAFGTFLHGDEHCSFHPTQTLWAIPYHRLNELTREDRIGDYLRTRINCISGPSNHDHSLPPHATMEGSPLTIREKITHIAVVAACSCGGISHDSRDIGLYLTEAKYAFPNASTVVFPPCSNLWSSLRDFNVYGSAGQLIQSVEKAHELGLRTLFIFRPGGVEHYFTSGVPTLPQLTILFEKCNATEGLQPGNEYFLGTISKKEQQENKWEEKQALLRALKREGAQLDLVERRRFEISSCWVKLRVPA